jgi:hypothetical protein
VMGGAGRFHLCEIKDNRPSAAAFADRRRRSVVSVSTDFVRSSSGSRPTLAVARRGKDGPVLSFIRAPSARRW